MKTDILMPYFEQQQFQSACTSGFAIHDAEAALPSKAWDGQWGKNNF